MSPDFPVPRSPFPVPRSQTPVNSHPRPAFSSPKGYCARREVGPEVLTLAWAVDKFRSALPNANPAFGCLASPPWRHLLDELSPVRCSHGLVPESAR
jgi:hypothetical protein